MKQFIAVTLMLAALALGAGVAVAQSDGVGAPTSAAGGVHPAPLVPPAHSLPESAGSQGSSATPGGGSTSTAIQDLTPGTGKFETPTNQPCVGTTGFGSSNVQPGHKC